MAGVDFIIEKPSGEEVSTLTTNRTLVVTEIHPDKAQQDRDEGQVTLKQGISGVDELVDEKKGFGPPTLHVELEDVDVIGWDGAGEPETETVEAAMTYGADGRVLDDFHPMNLTARVRRHDPEAPNDEIRARMLLRQRVQDEAIAELVDLFEDPKLRSQLEDRARRRQLIDALRQEADRVEAEARKRRLVAAAER